jgi:hypothetical protein
MFTVPVEGSAASQTNPSTIAWCWYVRTTPPAHKCMQALGQATALKDPFLGV